MYPGGNCFNVSVFASRFGAQSAFIGAIADDPAGRLIRGTLEQEGVDTRRLRVVDGITAYCIIGHESSDRVFLSNDFGVSRFTPDAGDLSLIAECDAAHVYQSCGLDGWLERFAARTKLSYDFSTKREAEHRERVAPHCWLASISASDLPPGDTVSLMKSVAAHGPSWVLATRGSHGAMLSNGQEIFSVAATLVDIVDTLGAGDTFIARVLVGLLDNEPPQAVLQEAADAAAQTCTYLGAVGNGSPVELPNSRL
ncbi:ribokinase-like domain-containing protein [Mesorhizobium alhagi CCNWXJ12-2]|uniref:Ribokinase-like domain-containing protein n=2 Tax=Allomesorhizobium alhagi TaxID=475067 RepID=H0I2M8_9HYPH|nr:ribokinase-like domain-containing protein [Mesorhizobium alhagi CCNWXJ12-2]